MTEDNPKSQKTQKSFTSIRSSRNLKVRLSIIKPDNGKVYEQYNQRENMFKGMQFEQSQASWEDIANNFVLYQGPIATEVPEESENNTSQEDEDYAIINQE